MFQGVRFGLGLDLSYKYSMSMAEEENINLLNSLIAYWKLDETDGTRYDSHGSYDLSEYGSGEIESGGGVISNSAIQNDLDEGVSLYIAPSPYDSVGASWSLSFWMSTNGEQDSGQIFPNAWTNCCLFNITTIDGVRTVAGSVFHDPTDVNQPTTTVVSKSGVYGGGFVHVAVTHDLPTKTIRVYYDGVEEHMFVYANTLCGVSPLAENPYENTLLSMFAGDFYGLGYAGPSKLDEIGIWGRALGADEVSALYNLGDGLAYEDFASVTIGDPNAWDVSELNLQTGLYTKQYYGYFTDDNSFFNDRNIAELGPSDTRIYQITRNADLLTEQAWVEAGFIPQLEYDTPESIGQPFPAVGKGVYYFHAYGSGNDSLPNNRVGPALKSEEVASVVYGNYSAVPNNESLIIRGYFKPDVSGLYTFKLASDDASYLWLGPNAFDANRTMSNYVVGVPGLHATQENTGTFNMVADLYYPLTIEFGNGPDGAGILLFEYLSPGSSEYSSVLTEKIAYNPVTKGH
jgi:hypothetical protein